MTIYELDEPSKILTLKEEYNGRFDLPSRIKFIIE